MKHTATFVKGETGRVYKKFYRKIIEIAPAYWFVKDYFLHVNLAWETHIFHIGDKKFDPTKNLKITIDIPTVD